MQANCRSHGAIPFLIASKVFSDRVVRNRVCPLLLSLLAWDFSACWASATTEETTTTPKPIVIRVKTTPAAREDLLKWRRKVWVGDYERAGCKDPKWDSKAVTALIGSIERHGDAVDDGTQGTKKISEAFQAAMDAGCTDPWVCNLYLRWGRRAHDLSTLERAERARKLVEGAEGREYSPLPRFYIMLRSSEMMEAAFRESRVTNWWREANALQGKAYDCLCQVLQDADTPSQEATTAFSAFLHSNEKHNAALDRYYPRLFRPVFEHWAKDPAMLLEESFFWRRYAWAARGSGWIDTVTEKGGQRMEERLLKAKGAVLKSWELDSTNPKTPTEMIAVLLGLEQDRSEMELWFNRAMNLDPNNYAACQRKLWYLDPRWHGSNEDLIAFGKECVASKKWGGNVPMTLLDAHRAIRAYNYTEEPERSGYWLRPEVWPDLKASLVRFAELNPASKGYRQTYALYAYKCQQWDELNRQLSLMTETNYSYFGGKAAFEKIVAEAASHKAGKN